MQDLSNAPSRIRVIQETLYTRQDCHHIVRWTPPVLQDVETQFTIVVDVWMKHLRYEFHLWRTIWVGFLEGHDQTERSPCKWCIG